MIDPFFDLGRVAPAESLCTESHGVVASARMLCLMRLKVISQALF